MVVAPNSYPSMTTDHACGGAATFEWELQKNNYAEPSETLRVAGAEQAGLDVDERAGAGLFVLSRVENQH